MIKEKFYNLLQELVHCEVMDVLEVQNYLKRLKDLEKHLDSFDKRLGEMERRYATLARSILNDGK
tara:strand:+ start:278 stop:472 length:195 start_codon:yes stop_codon:yes gene_type:complete